MFLNLYFEGEGVGVATEFLSRMSKEYLMGFGQTMIELAEEMG